MATDVQRGAAAETYDGGALSLDYARQKVVEFQQSLNRIDATANALRDAAAWASDAGDAQAIAELLGEYDERRIWIKGVAEAINAGAAAVNWAGGRMPSLSIPAGLGALPVVGLGAAVAAALAVISWGTAWIATAAERLRAMTDADIAAARIAAAQSLGGEDAARELARLDESRAAAARALAQVEAQSGGWSGRLLEVAKLVALGVAGFALWRVFQRRKGSDD